MQHLMDRISTTCVHFGLKIILRKTKVMFTPLPRQTYSETNMFVNGTRLEVVNTFIYLGITVSRDGSFDAEVYHRIGKCGI